MSNPLDASFVVATSVEETIAAIAVTNVSELMGGLAVRIQTLQKEIKK
jgi:hypothetical protein